MKKEGEKKLTPAPRKPKAHPTTQLPPLPMFGSANTDDGDAFHQWVSKLHRAVDGP